MSNTNDMEAMADRAERLINSLANAMTRTMEVAAQKVEQAAAVAEVRQRMSAFSAVLVAVGAQRQAVQEQIDNLPANSGALRMLYQSQLKMLAAQEIAILKQAGISDEAATQAVEDTDKVLYQRHGSKFVPVTNGTSNGKVHSN